MNLKKLILLFFTLMLDSKQDEMSQEDKTIYATGNGVKLDDFKAVLRQDIINHDLKPTEIQTKPIGAIEDKVHRCFETDEPESYMLWMAKKGFY